MLKGVLLLFWIFCYINLSNKILQFLFYFVLFFHCFMVEKGQLTRWISEGYLHLYAILNFLLFLVYDKIFPENPCPLFFFYWTEYLFMLYLYPVLWPFLYHPAIYTTLVPKRELKWNATNTIFMTCFFDMLFSTLAFQVIAFLLSCTCSSCPCLQVCMLCEDIPLFNLLFFWS